MPDDMSREQRSFTMSRIRSRGNKSTEIVFVQLLRRYGCVGWRRHVEMFGKPDVVFPRLKLAVFMDGCFWHRRPRCYETPKSNQDYWVSKLEGNARRDRLATARLKRMGWTVVRIWEHELRDGARRATSKFMRSWARLSGGTTKFDIAEAIGVAEPRGAYVAIRRRAGMAKISRSSLVGTINRQKQRVVRLIGPSAEFPGQNAYEMICERPTTNGELCHTTYAAYGCDINGAGAGSGRKCPSCQGGAP